MLRAVALLGICMVNAVDLLGTPVAAGEHRSGAAYWAYETLLHQRFFPIFSFLFGVSFGLFLRVAETRVRRPRVVMLARLGFLVPFGALHRLLYPDEVLLTYAVVGIAVLLPASFAPTAVVFSLGVLGVAAGVAVHGGVALIPGIFLLGLAAERYGVRRLLDAATGLGLGACVLAALVLDVWQVGAGAPAASVLAAGAGVATAAAYMFGVVVLLRTDARRFLAGLAPVGRMALSGYVGATVMILGVGRLVEPGDGPAVVIGAGVFAVEAVLAWVWSRYARYGPLEWVWRSLTWWRPVPMRRGRPDAPGEPDASGGGAQVPRTVLDRRRPSRK